MAYVSEYPPAPGGNWPKGTTDSGDVVIPTFLVIHYSSNFIETADKIWLFSRHTFTTYFSGYVFFSDVQSHIFALSSRSVLTSKSAFQRKG